MTQDCRSVWIKSTGNIANAYLTKYDDNNKLEFMSNIFLKPPTFLSYFNPIAYPLYYLRKKDAYKFITPNSKINTNEG